MKTRNPTFHCSGKDERSLSILIEVEGNGAGDEHQQGISSRCYDPEGDPNSFSSFAGILGSLDVFEFLEEIESIEVENMFVG